jgi:hypothetical protein
MLGVLSTSIGVSCLISVATGKGSFEPFLTAFAGQWLGMAGIYLGRRMGKVLPPLPVLGTARCVFALSPLYQVLLLALVIILLPIAIVGVAVSALINTLR